MFGGGMGLYRQSVLALPARRLVLGELVREATRKSLVSLKAGP
jgi:hypothetical protein